MIKMIAAVSRNGVIGKDNKLPFDYPEDLKFFRKMTANSAVIMGRKTWESIGRPLPKRRNIVISRTRVEADGVETFSCFKSAIESAAASHEDVWLIGGSSVYSDGMQFADEIYLTLIPDTVEGEGLVFFPWVDPSKFKVEEFVELPESTVGLEAVRYVRK